MEVPGPAGVGGGRILGPVGRILPGNAGGGAGGAMIRPWTVRLSRITGSRSQWGWGVHVAEPASRGRGGRRDPLRHLHHSADPRAEGHGRCEVPQPATLSLAPPARPSRPTTHRRSPRTQARDHQLDQGQARLIAHTGPAVHRRHRQPVRPGSSALHFGGVFPIPSEQGPCQQRRRKSTVSCLE